MTLAEIKEILVDSEIQLSKQAAKIYKKETVTVDELGEHSRIKVKVACPKCKAEKYVSIKSLYQAKNFLCKNCKTVKIKKEDKLLKLVEKFVLEQRDYNFIKSDDFKKLYEEKIKGVECRYCFKEKAEFLEVPNYLCLDYSCLSTGLVVCKNCTGEILSERISIKKK